MKTLRLAWCGVCPERVGAVLSVAHRIAANRPTDFGFLVDHEPGKLCVIKPARRLFRGLQTGRRCHGAGSEAVRVYNRNTGRPEHRPAGFGVEQMTIVLSLISNTPLVAAARGNGGVCQVYSAD